jgi:monoamine oxidase
LSSGIRAQSVAVIGAGLAGLVAAATLSQEGFNVIVLEARERAGGRTWSVREGFTAGQHGELGAELVTTGYRAFSALCSELDIGLTEHSWCPPAESATPLESYLSSARMILGGEPLVGNDLASVQSEVADAIRISPPEPHELIAQWTRRARLSYLSRRAVVAISRMPTQHDEFQIDGKFLFDTHFGEVRRVVGGSQAVANVLGASLEVRYERPVRSVRQKSGKVEVTAETGEAFTVDQAIVAVPPFVVPTIGFDPPLPAPKLTAISSFQRAFGGKISAQYEEGDSVRAGLTAWCFSDGPINAAWVSNPHVVSGPAVVSGHICGTHASLLTSGGEATDELDRIVEGAVGSNVTRIGQMTKLWSSDPYTFSIVTAPGRAQRDQAIALAASPDRRVHFAGDYTDVPLCGTMEGAVRSGWRAAGEVLRWPARIPLAEIGKRLVHA